MCDLCDNPGKIQQDELTGTPKRLWLWDFKDNVHCPLIGTCLTNQDLLNLTRKLKLQVNPDCKDYDLHSYFVTSTTKKSKEAKAIHKLLDDRHAGSLRKFKRLKTDDEIFSLWNEMKDSGQIAGAFYALMTLTHVSMEIRGTVFGEVHMLSHLMGASYRERSLQLALLKSRLDEIETRKSRIETGLHEALDERDQKIAELESQIQVLKAKAQPAKFVDIIRKEHMRSDKRNRAIEVARGKARAAEADKERVEVRLKDYRKRILELQKRLVDAVESETVIERRPKLDGRSILYVGGRPSQISHLEKTVDFFGAKFVHHDGGKEDAITRIDEVLSSVDCVFCPVNCVSHDACLRVKAGCKKYGKAFVPLRSSSQTTLHHALMSINGDFK
ncbi:MAG: DUF2325 domain-containing protein [Pseudomonadota bacterium]